MSRPPAGQHSGDGGLTAGSPPSRKLPSPTQVSYMNSSLSRKRLTRSPHRVFLRVSGFWLELQLLHSKRQIQIAENTFETYCARKKNASHSKQRDVFVGDDITVTSIPKTNLRI